MSPSMLEELPDYCSLLLMGPPGVGKFDYLTGVLKAYLENGQRVVFVCVDVSPADIRNLVSRKGGDVRSYMGRALIYVDCFSPSITDDVGKEAEATMLVSSFSNLEGLGMAVAKAAETLTAPVKILFYTISTLFLHNSPQSLSKFFQIVSARVRTQMGLILYACHQGVTEERLENLLRSLVDGVIDMRFEGPAGREIRLQHLRGYQVDPSWQPFVLNEEVATEIGGAQGVGDVNAEGGRG